MRAYLKSDDCLFLLSTKMTTIGREGCDLVLSVWFCHCIFWIVHKWCHAILGKNYRPYSFSHVSSRFSGPIQIWRHKLLTPSPLAVCSVVKFFYMIWHIWWGTAVFAGGHFWLNSIRVLVRVGIWLILFLHSCTASLHGWPLARYQSNGLILLEMSIFLLKSFISSIFDFLSIVQKHLAQTCGSITLADSQTFISVCLQR